MGRKGDATIEKKKNRKKITFKQISSSSPADTVYKLREESKLLRKAHQEVHSQLLSAQVTPGVSIWIFSR